MIQLMTETPDGEEMFLSLDPESLADQLRLPFPQEFDQTDLLEQSHRRRLVMFIDGANLFYAASQMGIEVDYAKLLRYFQKNSTLVDVFFYTGVDPSNLRQQSFLMWMRRNGYRVITKDVILNPTGTKRVGSMNVEIAVDMVRFALDCDTAILISGDGDLAYAVNAVISLGTRVEVYSLRSMTNDSLIQAANGYVDLASIKEEIQKTPR